MSWPQSTVNDISEIIDYGVTASAETTPVGPKFLRITDIQDDSVDWAAVPWCTTDVEKIKKSLLKKGDIVFARTGATTGKSYLLKAVPGNTVFASYLIRLRLGKQVDPGYVNHYFKSPDYWRQIARTANGAAQPGINASKLKQLTIPLPPLPEQKRIASILDATDALRSKRRESIAQLDTLLQSTFLDMFGDPVTNPMGWGFSKFGELGKARLGKMLDKGKSKGHRQFPYLANYNVQWGRFELGELREMEFSDDDRIEFSLREGDLLICEGGEIGRTAIWRNLDRDIYFQKALHRVRLDTEKATSEYIEYYMRFMAAKGGFKSVTNSATIAHLTGVKLKSLSVPVPPVQLQGEFSDIYVFVKAETFGSSEESMGKTGRILREK